MSRRRIAGMASRFDLPGLAVASDASRSEDVLRLQETSRPPRSRSDWPVPNRLTRHAWEIIGQIDDLLDYVAKHGTHAPLVFALQLGRDLERMSVRWAEHHVAASRRQRKGSSKGGKRTAALPERREAKQRTREALRAELADGWPITKARRRVAKKLGISFSTVKNHTTKKSGSK